MREAKHWRPTRLGAQFLLCYIPQEGWTGRGFTPVKGNLATRTERACRWLWSRGLYPGVAAVALRVHGHARANLNGTECRARRVVMAELGIPLQRQPGAAGLERRERLGWASGPITRAPYCKSANDLPADFGRVFEAAAKPGKITRYDEDAADVADAIKIVGAALSTKR